MIYSIAWQLNLNQLTNITNTNNLPKRTSVSATYDMTKQTPQSPQQLLLAPEPSLPRGKVDICIGSPIFSGPKFYYVMKTAFWLLLGGPEMKKIKA
jgi:hypothetical protein